MEVLHQPELEKQNFQKSPFRRLLVIVIILLVTGAALFLNVFNREEKKIANTQAAEIPLPSPTNSPGFPCPLFPADNVINRPITDLPVSASSSAYINTVGATTHLATGFGRPYPSPTPFGFPYNIVPTDQPLLGPTQYPIQWVPESDPHPYPVPANPLIQAPTDRHLLIVQAGNCNLYEFWHGYPPNQGATNEVTWNLFSNSYHTPSRNPNPHGGVTSADAAGLPILPLGFKYEEVMDAIAHRDPITGAYPPVRHAIRTTMHTDRIIATSWIWPAYHTDGSGTTNPATNFYPVPMGSRLRLHANFPVSGFNPQVQVMLNTLKTYGLILADSYNGNDYSEFSIGGSPNNNWLDPGTFNEQIHTVHLSDFDFVDESGIMVANNSMQAIMPAITGSPTPSPTITPIPSVTVILTPTSTSTPTPPNTPTPAYTPTPTRTPTPVPTALPSVTSIPSPTTIITDWQASYFNDRRVSNQWVHLDPARLALSRTDSSINFNWAHGSPSQSISNDHFSARWVKQLYFNVGQHSFTISHDDGARVYLDGVLVYNYWSNQSASNRTFSVNITNAGNHELRVEYFENSGNASIHLSTQ